MSSFEPPSNRYRTIFLSDVHLGTKVCQADKLLDFLKTHEADSYYLVGDIVDFWSLKKKAHWPQSHNDVVQKLLRKARQGARIVYVPGNHDEALRGYCEHSFGGIEIARHAVYTAADKRRYLILHGDEFDFLVFYKRWLAQLGDKMYEISVVLNRYFNAWRRLAGLPYWSFSSFLKRKMKGAFAYIDVFEGVLAQEAGKQDCHGVICGHIHHAAHKDIDGITYINTGDWVESCTAIVETHDGRFEILRWSERLNDAPNAEPIPGKTKTIPLDKAA